MEDETTGHFASAVLINIKFYSDSDEDKDVFEVITKCLQLHATCSLDGTGVEGLIPKVFFVYVHEPY